MTPNANAADAAEPIRDPVHRTSYTFRREGDNLWVETWFEDGAHLPEHYHPTLTEYWEIVDGSAQVKLNGRIIELTPEDAPVHVAPNDRHELRNISGRQVHARTQVIPAGRLQEFLTESGWAAREGLYNARNMPTSIRAAGWLADWGQRYRDETVATSPPPVIQRIVLPLLVRFIRRPALGPVADRGARPASEGSEPN
jgi:quercetin dioxygenase-like cupin family protein